MIGSPSGASLSGPIQKPALREPFLLLIVGALVTMGLMAIFSEGIGNPEGSYFKKQLMLVGIGVVPLILFARTRLELWQRFSTTIYVLNLLFLVLVAVKGETAGGAQRWIDIGPLQFQPSEFTKLATILTLSTFFASRSSETHRFATFALSFLHVAPSLLLVFLQPHLGATLVVFFTWLGLCIMAGVRWRFLVLTVAALVLVVGVAVKTPYLLKPYQRDRIVAMFVRDEKGRNYQGEQAAIAFGTGGLFGTGYLKGEHKARNYIPEQHNDFIFTVVGEEGGLAGCSLVLIGFGALFYRIWLVAVSCTDPMGRLCATGSLCVLGFHALVNLAMNLQVIPVVGLWLPFLSYGGTAIWLCLALSGLVLNVAGRSDEMAY